MQDMIAALGRHQQDALGEVACEPSKNLSSAEAVLAVREDAGLATVTGPDSVSDQSPE